MATSPIVVGADGSEASLRAVEWAALEAARRSAPLRIVAVAALPPHMQPRHEQPATVADVLDEASAQGLATAAKRATDAAPGVLVDTDLMDGSPARVLVEAANGASMLVVGARGAGEFTALILGSVGRYAAMHAPCPVVVAHEESADVHHEVAVGVGRPDEADEGTLTFAFEEAAQRGASLRAVHAWSRFPPAEPSDEAAARLTWILGEWRKRYPGIQTSQDVVHGHPGRILASFTARADLVVIGRHDQDGGPGVGSVQHALLNHAHGPVAVIPQQTA
jgi:nucleotide-binding universal stress UspA family protein